MELVLKCWFLEQQDKVNLNGDMLRVKAARFLQELHPDAPEMAFSQGWLEKFKDRHGIKSFCRFGESDALDMEAVGAALPDIRAIIDAYAKKDVFNMDEIGLCWFLQADNSLATHHSCHLRKLGQQRKNSVDDHRQALESTLFQGYQ